MPNQSWTRLDLGYELCSEDAEANPASVAIALQFLAAALPDTRIDLCKAFKPGARMRWALGDQTAVGSIGNDHKWVAKVLETELNDARENPQVGIRFEILETDLVRAKGPFLGGTEEPKKPVGTRCVLIGDRWYNHRSYRINPNVIQLKLPDKVVFFASLWWPCEDAESDVTALLSTWVRESKR